jgi:hypothetical protein
LTDSDPLTPRERERRLGAFRLALLEWGVAGILVPGWLVVVQLAWSAGGQRGRVPPAGLLFLAGLWALGARRKVAEGKANRETVHVVPLASGIAAAIGLISIRGADAWAVVTPCLAFAALGTWTSVLGYRALYRVPPPTGRAIPETGAAAASLAGWLIRIGALLVYLPSFAFSETHRFLLLLFGVLVLGFAWIIGREAALRRLSRWATTLGTAAVLGVWCAILFTVDAAQDAAGSAQSGAIAAVCASIALVVGTNLLLARATRPPPAPPSAPGGRGA